MRTSTAGEDIKVTPLKELDSEKYSLGRLLTAAFQNMIATVPDHEVGLLQPVAGAAALYS